MLSQETVPRNRIDLTAREKAPNSHQMLNYSDMLFIYLFILSRKYSEATKAERGYKLCALLAGFKHQRRPCIKQWFCIPSLPRKSNIERYFTTFYLD